VYFNFHYPVLPLHPFVFSHLVLHLLFSLKILCALRLVIQFVYLPVFSLKLMFMMPGLSSSCTSKTVCRHINFFL